jgi:glycosyltransferase involved in cell wall biosynthesis
MSSSKQLMGANRAVTGRDKINEKAKIEAALEGRRVIIVLTELELGGAERQAMLLAKFLAHEQKAHVEVWGFLGQPGRVAKLCEEYGIPWRITPWPWSDKRSERLKRMAQFAWRLRRARPDILLPYLIFPNVICGQVWRLTGARTCIWNQRDEGIGRMPRAERRAARQVPLFISNSQAGANFLTDKLGAKSERVHVIHNGVTLAPVKADRDDWRRELALTDDSFLACMVANLTQYKDHDTLLRAWRLVVDALAREGRSAVLLLAGRLDSSDSTHHSVKALAYDLDLGKSVRFLGQVLDLSGLLGAIEIGVFSSRSEGSPNGVLECMAAGLAVAGTDIIGISEAVGPSGQPYLAPPGDAESLADRILKLAADPALRARLGAANRLRIETEFSPKRMCEQVLALMVEGLQGKS